MLYLCKVLFHYHLHLDHHHCRRHYQKGGPWGLVSSTSTFLGDNGRLPFKVTITTVTMLRMTIDNRIFYTIFMLRMTIDYRKVKCESVRVWKCESVRVWKCESVKVRMTIDNRKVKFINISGFSFCSPASWYRLSINSPFEINFHLKTICTWWRSVPLFCHHYDHLPLSGHHDQRLIVLHQVLFVPVLRVQCLRPAEELFSDSFYQNIGRTPN